MRPAASKLIKARVLIVDSHALFREGVRQCISRQKDLVCCGEADCKSTTLQAVQSLKPDLVLLELRLRHEAELDLIKSLRSQFPALCILVLSQQDEARYAERTLQAGANGYVMKEEATEEILLAIRTVLAGQYFVSRKMAVTLLKLFLTANRSSPRSGEQSLSDREFQVFQMLGAGLSSRQIAERLGLSVKTVETHRENIKHKLGLGNGTALVRHATSWLQAPRSPATGPPPVSAPVHGVQPNV